MSDPGAHTTMNQAKFDAWSDTYESRRYDFFRILQKRVLSRLDLREGASFLDVGCGTGWAVRQAAAIVGETGRASGVDLSPGMIEKARQGASAMRNVDFQQANAEELPFAGRSFDRIICTMSFHHYLHPGKAMSEFSRVLKPGGRACIVDPTADSFVIRWADSRIKSRQPEHVKLYSTSEFRKLFEDAGLRYVGSSRVLFLWFSAKAHVAERS